MNIEQINTLSCGQLAQFSVLALSLTFFQHFFRLPALQLCPFLSFFFIPNPGLFLYYYCVPIVRIGVLSDTHIPERARLLPPAVRAHLAQVDRIFHAGDIVQPSVLEELGTIAPVTAVRGNMDSVETGLPVKRELTFAGVTIGLIHGWGGPKTGIRGRIRREFKNPRLIVYGHTHEPFWGEEDGVWFLNPGSPTDMAVAPFRSLGMLTLDNGEIRGEIIRL